MPLRWVIQTQARGCLHAVAGHCLCAQSAALPTFSSGSNLVPYASIARLPLPLRPVCHASYRHLQVAL